jgi:hypothetical protein
MLAVVIVPVATACSDMATEPNSYERMTRQFYYGNEQFHVVGRSYHAAGGTAAVVIGSAGGTVSAGGVKLVIPPGALDSNVEITLTVPAGNQLNVQLEPHGLQFKKPAHLSFALTGTMYDRGNAQTQLAGVYHQDGVAADAVTPVEIMNVQMVNGLASFGVWHFSDYALTQNKKGIILVGG